MYIWIYNCNVSLLNSSCLCFSSFPSCKKAFRLSHFFQQAAKALILEPTSLPHFPSLLQPWPPLTFSIRSCTTCTPASAWLSIFSGLCGRLWSAFSLQRYPGVYSQGRLCLQIYNLWRKSDREGSFHACHVRKPYRNLRLRWIRGMMRWGSVLYKEMEICLRERNEVKELEELLMDQTSAINK